MSRNSSSRRLSRKDESWKLNFGHTTQADVISAEYAVRKLARDTMKWMAEKAEEQLGTTGLPLAVGDEARERVMVTITILNDTIDDCLEQHDDIVAQLTAQYENEVVQLTARHANEVALFTRENEELRVRNCSLEDENLILRQIVGQKSEALDAYEEAGKSKRKKKDSSAEEVEKSAAEKIEESRKREAALERAIEREKKRRESVIAEEASKKNSAEASTPTGNDTNNLPEEMSTAATGTASSEPENTVQGNSSQEARIDTPTAETTEENELKAQEEKAEREITRGDQELLNYLANRNFETSSIPSRHRGYQDGKTNEGRYTYTAGTGNLPDGNASATSESEMERACCQAALHSSDKSPNRKAPTGVLGKPEGADGGGRTIPNRVDQRITTVCPPSQCANCHASGNCENLRKAREQAESDPNPTGRRVYDMEIITKLTTYVPLKLFCPEHQQKLTGEYPEDLHSSIQYGTNLRTLCVALSTMGMMSYRRIASLVGALIEDSLLSSVSVMNWVKQAARQLEPTLERIRAAASEGECMNADETGVRVKGIMHWIHIARSGDFIYMRAHKKRGRKAMNDIGILPSFTGTLVTDCWQSYWGYCVKHCLCCAHLTRELYALEKFFSKDKEWATEARELLQEMDHERNVLIEQGIDHFEKETLDAYFKRYDEIVEKGLKLHPDKKGGRKNAAREKARCLLDRMKDYKENFLGFMRDFSIPFSNNDAERPLRNVSQKRSVAGSFSTLEGADDFAKICSYVLTACNLGVNPYEAIAAAVAGDSSALLFTPEEAEHLDKRAAQLRETSEKIIREEKEEEERKRKEKTQKAEGRLDGARRREAEAEVRVGSVKTRIQEISENLGKAEQDVKDARIAAAFSQAGVLSGGNEGAGTRKASEKRLKAANKALKTAEAKLVKARKQLVNAQERLEKAEKDLENRHQSVQKAEAALQKILDEWAKSQEQEESYGEEECMDAV